MDDSQTDTLRGIKLTKAGKTPIKELEYVKDSKRAEILWEYARDAILAILRNGIPDTVTTEEIEEETGQKLRIERHLTRHALSIVELAKLSANQAYVEKPITKSQVIHHLPILIEHGYVVKYGTLKSGKRSTDYYRRTSELFLFVNMPGVGIDELEESFTEMIFRIEEVYNLSYTKSEKNELLKLFLKADSLLQEGREYFIQRARTDIARRSDVELHRRLYQIYAFKSEEWIETNRRINEILFSK